MFSFAPFFAFRSSSTICPTLLVIFYGALLQGWWIALAGAIVLFIAISGWLWPSDITAEKEALS
jgi:CHASE2 domain-containing sensor protein